jgi:hypothetical protein
LDVSDRPIELTEFTEANGHESPEATGQS